MHSLGKNIRGIEKIFHEIQSSWNGRDGRCGISPNTVAELLGRLGGRPLVPLALDESLLDRSEAEIAALLSLTVPRPATGSHPTDQSMATPGWPGF